ncbi:hypothetical protein IM511_04160 [Erythrobacteraceae bacterium E2-1 Yellow Sea]|nr:hypothetical protein [Erythrobacteraceae bacterium E2-1 Yellow Sea]
MLATLALAGCSSASHNYPSLAIRDAERVSGTFAVTPGTGDQLGPAPASPNVLESLPEQLVLSQTAHDSFMGLSAEAERLVLAAQGTDTDSNAWAAAQIALAQLESQRSQSAIALATLDLHYADASLGFTAREEIDAVRSQVLSTLRQEDEVLARLRSAMPD